MLLFDDFFVKYLKKIGPIHLNYNSINLIIMPCDVLLTTVKSPVITQTEPKTVITNNNRSQFLPAIIDNNKDINSALRRRRDRFARQAHHIIQQQELLNNSHSIYNGLFESPNGNHTNTNGSVTTTNSNYTNGTYANTNGSSNNHYNTNGFNGHEGEDLYNSRKSSNLDVLLKNGLFIS